MYTYSLTISLEKRIEPQWLDYIRQTHIPAIEETGYFSEVTLLKITDPVPEEESVTYNILCKAETMEHLRLYMSQDAKQIHSAHDTKFTTQFHAVDALLKDL